MKLSKYIPASLLLLPASALAQGLTPPAQPTGLPGAQGATISQVLLTYINVALMAVGIIAVGFLIIGGFRYITSGGNDEAAESGKKMITNAIIGLVVIILSYTIITVIISAIAKGQA